MIVMKKYSMSLVDLSATVEEYNIRELNRYSEKFIKKYPKLLCKARKGKSHSLLFKFRSTAERKNEIVKHLRAVVAEHGFNVKIYANPYPYTERNSIKKFGLIVKW